MKGIGKIPLQLFACALGILPSISAQTVYIPSGSSGIGSSANSNVGVGTSSPEDKLHVHNGNLLLNNGYQINWKNSSGTVRQVMQLYSDNNFYFTNSDGAMIFRPGGAEYVRFTSGGMVGIGTNAPSHKLVVAGTWGSGSFNPQEDLLHVGSHGLGGNGSYAGIRIGGYYNEEYGSYIRSVKTTAYGDYWNSALTFSVTRTNTAATVDEVVRITSSGNVGIGTTSPSHKLAVSGTVRAKEVIVDTGWADHVFADDYRLAPLNEVETHIRERKHLPGIPTAAEVAGGGVSVGAMQAKLLEKIEELTLHVIALEKRTAALESENGRLRERFKTP